MPTNIEEYNNQMAAVVQHLQQQKRSVFYHDPNCNRTDETACSASDKPTWADGDYYTYGIHFSVAGYAKMAHRWAQALLPQLHASNK